MLVNLARGCAAQGIAVDLVVSDANAPFLNELESTIRVFALGDISYRKTTAGLTAYLKKEHPAALLTGKPSDDKAALKATQACDNKVRCYLGAGTAISRQIDERRFNPLRKRIKLWKKRRYYRQADGIIATSNWVARDIARISGLTDKNITVIGNPVIQPEIETLARQAVTHQAFAAGAPPVILGAGRLSEEKDFITLLHAFAIVRQQRPASLVILGEGPLRTQLQDYAHKLGINDNFYLPGFVTNPYAYMSKASVFALSSLWEGFGNVIVEAMACGTAVVATNCPGGPCDILQNGKLGHLVPVGNVEAMAQAIIDSLEHPLEPQLLVAGIEAFTIHNSAKKYIATLKLTPHKKPPHS